MYFKSIHEKIIKNLENLQNENFIESLSFIEHLLQQKNRSEENISIYPTIVNFQITNEFLKTKINSNIERLLLENNKEINYDENINKTIDFFNDLELEEVEEINEDENKKKEILENFIKEIY